MEAHFEHHHFHSVTQLCEKYSGAPSEAYRGVLRDTLTLHEPSLCVPVGD